MIGLPTFHFLISVNLPQHSPVGRNTLRYYALRGLIPWELANLLSVSEVPIESGRIVKATELISPLC